VGITTVAVGRATGVARAEHAINKIANQGSTFLMEIIIASAGYKSAMGRL
jgi:hypothetical protein